MDRHHDLCPLRDARAPARGRYTARRARGGRRGRAAATAVGRHDPVRSRHAPRRAHLGCAGVRHDDDGVPPPARGGSLRRLASSRAPLPGRQERLCHTRGRGGGGHRDHALALTVGLMDMSFPTIVVLNDDTAHTGTTDSLTVGKSVPGGTYNWFFPTGTTAVLSGRWNDQARLQLSKSSVAWVNAADVVPLPAGTPPPGGVVGSVRLRPGPASITLRVPLPEKLPFQVAEQERTLTLRLYGEIGRAHV